MPALALLGTAVRAAWGLIAGLLTWRSGLTAAATFLGFSVVIRLRKSVDDAGDALDAAIGSIPFTIEPDPDKPGGTILVPKTGGPFGSTGIDVTALLIGGGVALGIVILVASRR